MNGVAVRMVQSLIFILVSVWVLLSLLLYIFQPQYIYYPYRELAASPRDADLAYEEVHLTTMDEIGIHGWFLPHEQPRATLLFLHGNGGNISHRLDKLDIYHRLGLAVFIIDYRGYGMSQGKPSEQGTYLDAEAAWDYLVVTRSLPEKNIIIYGESLGGAVAAWLATQHQPGAVILESTFTSIKDMGRHYYPWLPIRWITRIKYPVLGLIKQVRAPVLIIHSPTDDIVPYAQGRKLFEAANEPKSFLEIIGDHNNGFMDSNSRYLDGIDKFLSAYFKK
ncbi:MAG: alpha/beta hydrolase [Gammaproteobacteria bacterium]